MGMKASAHSNAHGALWSTSCEPSAAESCFADAVGCQNDALCTLGMLAITRIVDRRTQWMVLSAAIKHSMNGQGLEGTHAGLLRLEDAFRVVIVDHEDTVSRRRRHRAGMHRRRPQGQRSPLWPQWAAAWPLVPRSRTLERPTLGSVRTFDPYVTLMSHMLTQPALSGHSQSKKAG